MRTFLAILLCFGTAPLLLGAPGRVSYERILPAPHDLGKVKRLAVVRAPAGAMADYFVEEFIDRTNRAGVLELIDGRGGKVQADAYLEVLSFKCDTATRESEASVRDVDGNRVKRRLFSVDAICVARIDALSRQMKRLSSFYAKGEGTTPNVERVTAEEHDDALRRAVRHAAVFGADRITPRRVRESIELDARAPAYSEALAMIEIDRLVQARAIFERELQRNPRSAPLRFNLGALYEALGDRVSAEKHYTAAKVLAPEERRYATELKRFSRQQQ